MMQSPTPITISSVTTNTATATTTNNIKKKNNTNTNIISSKRGKKTTTMNNVVVSSNSTNTKTNTNSNNISIKIRPYQRIPQLPINYYEMNRIPILQFCYNILVTVLLQQPVTTSSTSASTTTTTTTNSTVSSLQQCSMIVMDLVRHQLGIQFYNDIIYHHMIPIIVNQILPLQYNNNNNNATPTTIEEGTNKSSYSNSNSDDNDNNNNIALLQYIVQQYKIYISYITKIIQPICLPMDQMYVWNWNININNINNNNNDDDVNMTNQTNTEKDNVMKSDEAFIASLQGGTAIPIHTTTTTTSTTTTATTSSSSHQQQNPNQYQYQHHDIWMVCITLFMKRLQYLNYTNQMYHIWIQYFLLDWNTSSSTSSSSSSSSSSSIDNTISNITSSNKNNNNNTSSVRYVLKEIWFMWYDLHLLSTFPIQQDIYNYWYNQCYNNNNNNSNNNTEGFGGVKVVGIQQEQPLFIKKNDTNKEFGVSNTSSSSNNNFSITQFVLFCHERLQHITNHLQYIHQTNYHTSTSTNSSSSHNNNNMMALVSSSSTTTPGNSVSTTATSSTWLYHIFDISFMVHHFDDSNNNDQNVFNDKYFFPLLHEHLFHTMKNPNTISSSGTSSSNYPRQLPSSSSSSLIYNKKYNIIQQLWILAGRVPNGQSKMNYAIQRYAKYEGYNRIMGKTSNINTSMTTKMNTSSMTIDATTATAAGNTTSSSSNSCNNGSVIEDLLELQNALHQLVQQLSAVTSKAKHNTTNNTSTTTIQNLLKSVWEEIMNVELSDNVTSSFCIAEQLAKFLDSTLRSTKKMDALAQEQHVLMSNMSSSAATNSVVGGGGGGGVSTTTSTDDYRWLQRIIHGIFVPLQAKDIFEAFYKRDLAKRLLWNRIVNMDTEKYVCSLLKAECGTGYTSKIEGMFQDVDWSRETMLLYKQQQQQSVSMVAANTPSAIDSSIEVEVQVLTTGYWPVYPIYPNLILPESLIQQQQQFASYYHGKHQGRRMVWQYALGHCVVRVNGFNKPYELVVSLCQAIVLIQFTSDTTCLSLPQLLQATGLEDRNEMECILQSLALGKEGTRILRKIEHTSEPGKKTKILMTIDDRDTFMINTKFESKVRRIRITNVMMKETKEEREKTVETVSRDRLYLIDAVLVRIMKARKTILHQALIPQVLEQIRVPAQAADVKKRIESLIEREYMERDSNDRNRYNYLA